MNPELTRLAKEYVAGNKKLLIQYAIDYCMFNEVDPDKDVSGRYEQLLRTTAQTENDKLAAAAYMLIALHGQTEGVFTKENGIQLLLQTDALDTYQKLLEDDYSRFFDSAIYDYLQNEVKLLIWEFSHGIVTSKN